MAGQLKEVRNRIKSVQSTQQITKAMKMVSAAKLRRAQDAITQMRPYANKLQEMLSNIVSNLDGGVAIKLAEERTIEKVLLIVITSDRGLCGGYNANLIKECQSRVVIIIMDQIIKIGCYESCDMFQPITVQYFRLERLLFLQPLDQSALPLNCFLHKLRPNCHKL